MRARQARLAKLLAFGVALSAGPATGEVSQPLPVAIAIRTGGEIEVAALIRATPRSPNAGAEATGVREWRVEAPWQGQIELDGGQSWSLEAIATGHWAPPQELEAGADRGGISFELLPLGKVAGRFVAPTESPPELGLSAEVRPAPVGDRTEGPPPIPTARFACEAGGGHWTCELPAARIDLRLEFDGFVPSYYWGVEVKIGRTAELGTVELERGSSLVGWVELAASPADEAPVEVRLKPQVVGWQVDPLERQRIDRRELRALADERGFFQFKAIAPGGYSLTAARAGFSPTEIHSLVVEEDRELIVSEPIVLGLPATLEVYLDPLVDSNGQPWRVILMRPEPLSNVYQTLNKSTATLEGYWQQGSLAPGTYRIEVRDSLDSSWLAQEIRVESGTQPLFLTMDTVAIRGSISAGDEPLRTEIIFGTSQRRPNVRFVSDDRGRFEGHLPHGGTWPVEITVHGGAQMIPAVEVARKPGRSHAVVQIELPDTLMSGQVADGDEPATDAFVLVKQAEGGQSKAANLAVDEDGEFELRGLPAGRYAVSAYRSRQTSDWSTVDLLEGVPAPHLHLDLEPKTEIVGRIVAESGDGVPGAQLRALPVSHGAAAWPAVTVTDTTGAFSLEVSSEVATVDLVVLASGFGFEMLRVRVADAAASPLVLSVAQGGGRLVLPIPLGDGYTLQRNGAALRLPRALPYLLGAGVLRPNAPPVGGLLIANAAPGVYAVCPGEYYQEEVCAAGQLGAYGELMLISPGTVSDEGEPDPGG